jgi:hypothetical protein
MIVSWSIIILASISLIIFLNIRNKNKGKKTLLPLFNFAKENNSSISSYDHWDKTLIGIDNNEINKLFFIRTTPSKEYREAINLSEVVNCVFHKAERTVSNKEAKVIVIDRIELVFSFVNNQKPAVILEFYNSDYDNLTISDELQFAQKWSGVIKGILATNKNREKEASKAKIQEAFGVNETVGLSPDSAGASKRKAKYATHAI